MFPDRTIRFLGQFFDSLGLPWVVTGGHAANVYRDDIRNTGDVDLVASLGDVHMDEVVRKLQNEGWQLLHGPADRWMIRIRHPRYGIADVVATGMDYQEQAVERANAETLDDGFVVRYMTVEDILIHKLIANRSKDDDDVVSILKTSPHLDAD